MMGYGFGMGAWGWVAMSVFWIAVLALLVWLIVRAFPDNRRDKGAGGYPVEPRQETRGESPEQVLDRRFASGEIDATTYESMRATLRANRTGP